MSERERRESLPLLAEPGSANIEGSQHRMLAEPGSANIEGSQHSMLAEPGSANIDGSQHRMLAEPGRWVVRPTATLRAPLTDWHTHWHSPLTPACRSFFIHPNQPADSQPHAKPQPNPASRSRL